MYSYSIEVVNLNKNDKQTFLPFKTTAIFRYCEQVCKKDRLNFLIVITTRISFPFYKVDQVLDTISLN